MRSTTVLVVGAGHCGLAMSRHLAARSIEHVVLERGEVANSWRTQRWDSLRLLTPNWMTRLPDFAYAGDDPDGYLSAREVADLVESYAAWSGAPVLTGVRVDRVTRAGDHFEVATDAGPWQAQAVVLATGSSVGTRPAVAAQQPDGIHSVSAVDYRGPDGLPEGGVLVVGAAASGVQIALELHESGRPVTLAVGEHVRMPRRYRGHDILWWLDAAGILDEGPDEIEDMVRARNLPSMQLVGGDRTVDLNSLQASGVRLVGRVAGFRGDIAQFAGSLPNVCALADLKLTRLLNAVDDFAGGRGERDDPTRVPAAPLELDLRAEGIRTVLWATGIKPDLSTLDDSVFDARKRLKHDGGVTSVPGLYVLGLPMLRRRRSSFIDGAAGDADILATHLAAHLHAGQAERTGARS